MGSAVGDTSIDYSQIQVELVAENINNGNNDHETDRGINFAEYNEKAEAAEGSTTRFVLRHNTDPSKNIVVEIFIDEDSKKVEWESELLPKNIIFELGIKKFSIASKYPLICLNLALNIHRV